MDSKRRQDEGQAARFEEAARAIGADEDMAAFRAKLAVIARQQPKAEGPPEAKAAKQVRKSRRSIR